MVATFVGFALANSSSDFAEITFLDVGKGDSIFIRTATGKTILVDGGGGAPFLSSSDVGARVVLPFLRFRGINKIDYLIATHRDQDHIGGLFSVIRDINIGQIFDSGIESDTFEASDFERTIKEKGIPVSVPKFLQETSIDDVTKIIFLGPPQIRIPGSDNSTMTNENSVACILEIEKVRILLAADIQTEAMRYELGYRDKLKCDIIKLPHHGNYSAGFSDWFEAVNPKIIINSDSGSWYWHRFQVRPCNRQIWSIYLFNITMWGNHNQTSRRKLVNPNLYKQIKKTCDNAGLFVKYDLNYS